MVLAGSNSTQVPDLAGRPEHASGIAAAWAWLTTNWVPFLFCAALWAGYHPYTGIIGDSHIYVGAVLAQLDPDGVGRDMIFVNDGQFRFSVFPMLIRPLVAHLGVGAAAQLVSGLASTCWFAAAFALARQLASGRAIWLVLIFVCVLPHTYGQQLFVTAETQIVPRPFAEASVLAALAALSAGRIWQTSAFLLVGVMVHPIMALPGLATVALISFRDWRVFVALGVAAAAAAGLGIAGVPVFERLFARLDSDWFAMLAELGPTLFPTHWASADFGPLVVQATTLVIAASLFSGFPRRLFVATGVVGAAGVLGAMVFGDLLLSVLVVQAQTWRSIWLMTVVAEFAYALCLVRLWSEEGERRMIGRTVLAFLTVGAFCHPDLQFALVLSVLALGLHFGRFKQPISPRYLLLTSIALLVLIGTTYVQSLLEFVRFVQHLPSDAAFGRIYVLRMDVIALPICLAGGLWFALRPALFLPRYVGQFAAIGLTIVAALTWSWRSQASKDLETIKDPPEFAPVLANRPGEVLWVNGRDEAWTVLNRPQWASKQQAVAAVFSRTLAMHWLERAKALSSDCLMTSMGLQPPKGTEESSVPTVTRETLQHVCGRPDAPVAVIFPVEKGKPLSQGVTAAIWSLPHSRYSMDLNGTYTWHEIDRYAAASCSSAASMSTTSSAR